MLSTEDNGYTLGLDCAEDCVGELHGKAFLKLRAVRQYVQRPRKFAGAHHATIGDVADAGIPEEGKKMVLADGEEGYVLEGYHLPMPLFKAGGKHLGGVLVQPREELLVHLSNPPGRLSQPFSLGVLADGLDD